MRDKGYYIQVNQYSPVTVKEAETLNRLYQTGLSSYEVGRRLGRSYKTVTNSVLRCGGKLRNDSDCQKRLKINESYFQYIDSPVKAYLLGFIYADGNVFKNRFKMSLWATDKYFLELFAKEIGFDGHLYREKAKISTRQDMWTLTVYSRVFVGHLRDKGVVDNKVNILTFPEWLEQRYWKYFIHGLLDGDGSITHSKYGGKTHITLGFAGAKPLIARLQEIIEAETGEKGSFFGRPDKNGGRLDFSGYKAFRVCNYLYRQTPPFFLKRKLSKYAGYLKTHLLDRQRIRADIASEIEIGQKIICSHEKAPYSISL